MDSERDNLVYAGQLYRLGNSLKSKILRSWTKRLVELRDDVLYYYNSKGAVTLTLNGNITFEDSNLRHFCFCLTDQLTGESYYFAAENGAEKEIWAEKIRFVIMKSRHLYNRSARSAIVSVAVRKEYQSRPILLISVNRARNIVDKDIGGTSDPYVTICVGSSLVKTEIRKKTLNPEWNASFSFDLNRSCRYAKIEVWDKDITKSDDFIGTVLISLLPLRDGYNVRKWFPLQRKSSRDFMRGEIELEITYSGDPDPDKYSYHFFHSIQTLPDLKLNLINKDLFSSFDTINYNSNNENTSNVTENINTNEKINTNINETDNSNRLSELPPQPQNQSLFQSDSFPWSFPPIELEQLEDISVRTQLSSTSYSSSVISKGILLLTNYRLIFLPMTRIITEDKSINYNKYLIHNLISNGTNDPNMLDLTTYIPLGCIYSISLSTEPDLAGNPPYEILKIKTVDNRNISFILRDETDISIALASASTNSSNIVQNINQNISNLIGFKKPIIGKDISSPIINPNINPSNNPNIGNLIPIETKSRPQALKRSITNPLSMLEISWNNLISNDTTLLIDGMDSEEGSPFARIYHRLNLYVSCFHSLLSFFIQ